MPRSSRRLFALHLALLLAGAALSGCLDSIEATEDDHHDEAGDHHGEAAPPPPPPTGPIDVRLAAQSGTEANELGITPNPLEIPLGKNVELTVRNEGGAPHTFTIHGYGLNSGRLQAGESKTFSFHAERAGTFEIMCDEPGHYDAGMKAKLVVA